MTQDRDFTAFVEAQLRDVPRLRSEALQEVFEQAESIPQRQRRRWSVPSSIGRFQSMFSATKFVVAGAIVALFGGFLLTGVFTQQPNEGRLDPAAASLAASESVQEASPSVTAEATAAPTSAGRPGIAPPRKAGSGRLETPLGPARWVHLSGGTESMPQFLEPVPVPDGYVTLVETRVKTGAGSGHLETTGLWSSADLLRWTARSLPDGMNMGFAPLGGALWMLTIPEGVPSYAANTPDLWRSIDGSAWESIDPSGLFPPAPDDIAWSVGFGEVVSKHGIEVMPLTFEARWAASHLRPSGARDGSEKTTLPTAWDPQDPRGSAAWGIEPLDNATYQVTGGYGEDVAVVRFEPIEDGLRVVDASGVELTTLPGWDIGFVDRWADSWGYGEGRIPIEHRVGVVRGGEIVAVEPPGAGPGGPPSSIVPTDEGFTLYRPQEDGTTKTWRSSDGLAWSRSEVVGDGPGEPLHIVSVRTHGTGLEAETRDPDGGTSRTWRSTDGATWQRFEPAPDEAKPDWQARIGSGRLVIQKGKLEFRPDDGSESTRIDTKRMGLKARPDRKAGRLRGSALSDHAVVISRRQGGVHDHWIIVFDDLQD